MHPMLAHGSALTRRHFFQRGAIGLGAAALSALTRRDAAGSTGEAPSRVHHPARAKHCISLIMNGGPSQLDLWDHKPVLREKAGGDLPSDVRGTQLLTLMTANNERFALAPSRFRFDRYGRNGTWASELVPHTASVSDEMTIIRSMHTEEVNHDPAVTYLCTGQALPGRPSMGSWISYGLGSVNDHLPTFVVMSTRPLANRFDQSLFSRLWGAGFLPSKFQGVALRSQGDPILFLNNPPGIDAATRERMLSGLERLNQQHLARIGDAEIQTRIDQYEMAFRLQTSVPDLLDFRDEPAHVLNMYGHHVHRRGSFAASCLLARRLVERGVRYVQIFHRGWDHHIEVPRPIIVQAEDMDQPCAALLRDLKQRGLLDETIVSWGGEFGRTCYSQGSPSPTAYGRDHHRGCFTMWAAGGGFKAGYNHGETDEFGFNIVRDPVHIQDFNATILHCLGLDYQRLTYRHQGLDFRPTGPAERQIQHDLLV